MIVKISGQSGYIGTALSTFLQKQGFQVGGIPRALLYGEAEPLASFISGADVVVHLSGASILQRWTSKNKKIITDSRLLTSRKLVKAVQALPPESRPKRIVAASAIGIYQANSEHSESSTSYDNGFVGKLVQEWEAEWQGLTEECELYLLRIGLVLGKESKTIKNLLPVFKAGLGGKIGNGQQAFPFVHEQDLVKCFKNCIEGKLPEATYNLVAPESCSNLQFTKQFAELIKRKALIPVPGFMLKLIFGEASSLLLSSPAVIPVKLIENNFRFEYPNIKATLHQILS